MCAEGLGPGVAALLAETGRSISSFPADISTALTNGKVALAYQLHLCGKEMFIIECANLTILLCPSDDRRDSEKILGSREKSDCGFGHWPCR